MDVQKVKIGPFLTDRGCVARFRAWLAGEFGDSAGSFDHPQFGLVMVPPGRERIIASLPVLRGFNFACWCPLDQPCHADVLLEIANR